MGDLQLSSSSLLDVSGGPAGSVSIRAEDLTVSSSVIEAKTEGAAAGLGGIDISVRDDVVLRGETEIAAGTEGAGAGADVEVKARTLSVIEEAQILSSSISDQVIFATLMDQLGFRHEAARQWLSIAEERPDDPYLSRYMQRQ